MAVNLSVLLILTGLTGVHSLTTVSKVSVEAGHSISIPCLYELEYKEHVKYLCKGSSWSSCYYVIKTNQPSSSGRFSISDDKNQLIFTVTMKQLTKADTDYYWCIVEIIGGTDYGNHFHLLVTSGQPSLSVKNQEVTGFIGESVTIKCNFSVFGVTEWCRLGRDCVKEVFGSIDGTNVSIRKMLTPRVPNVFTVTMSGLRPESSGWYWCAKGLFQMPVHLTVTAKPTTTPNPAIGDTTNITVTKGQDGGSTDLMMFIIPLGLLIVIVIVALLVCFMLRRKQTKAGSSATTTADEDVTYCDIKHKRKTSSKAEENVMYSNVGYIRDNSAQRSVSKSDEDEMYTSVVILKPQPAKRQAEPEAVDITYSTLAVHRHNQHS